MTMRWRTRKHGPTEAEARATFGKPVDGRFQVAGCDRRPGVLTEAGVYCWGDLDHQPSIVIYAVNTDGVWHAYGRWADRD